MAQEFKVLDISLPADNAITTGQIVKVTSTGCDVSTAATDAIIGVAMYDVTAGTMATIRVAGAARVQASAAISIGAFVTATTAGQAVTTTKGATYSATADFVLGRALEAATAQNDMIPVLLGVFSI